MKRLMGKSCLILLLLLLSVAVFAGGSHGAHSLTIKVEATGEGKVYLSKTSTPPANDGDYVVEQSEIVIKCDGSDEKNIGDCTYGEQKGQLYAFAKQNAGKEKGYYFAGWYHDGTRIFSDLNYTIDWGPQSSTVEHKTETYTAVFEPVAVTGATGNEKNIYPEALSGVVRKEIVFTQTGGDEQEDFNDATILATDGLWNIESTKYNPDDKKVHVVLTYTANRNTYKNSQGSRTDKAELTLTSKGGGTYTCPIEAEFPIGISAGTAEAVTLTYPATSVTGTAVFPVTYVDEKEDVSASVVSSAGEGEWTILSWSYANGQVMVEYRYRVGSTVSRNNTAVLTLAAKDGSSSATCSLTATCSVSIEDAAQEEYLQLMPTETEKTSVASFTVAYALGEEDLVLPPAISDVTGTGTWKVTGYTYTQGQAPLGTLTVDYTFAHDGTAGDYSALLTLTTKNGASSKGVTLRATVEAESEYDASVTTPAGVTTEYASWAAALTEANKEDGCTLRLLRNVDLLTITADQVVKKTMTLDLNGKTLSATTTASRKLLYLNTADKTLTIIDGRSNGTIRIEGNFAGSLYALRIDNGNLVLEKGRIEVVNSTTGNSDVTYAVGVYLKAGVHFEMKGGEIVSKHLEARNAYGIYAEAGSTVLLNAGSVEATAKTYAYGVRGYASATAQSEITLANATINSTATSTAYGIHSTGLVNVQGGIINATTAEVNGIAGGNTAYGIYMGASANADAAKCYYGTLNMTGGTVNATTAGTTARAILLQGTDGTISTNAPDGTHTNKSSSVATIRNAVLNAIAGGTTAQGVYVENSYNSKTNTTSPALLENVTINARAAGTAYGVYLSTAVNTTHGTTRQGEVVLNNCMVTATTTTGATAYGVYLGAAQGSITADNDWKGETYATAAKATITSGTYTATAATSTAYGIASANTSVSANGGVAASSELTVKDATIIAKTLGTTIAYGIQTGGPTVIDNCNITAEAKTTTARGVFLQDKTATISNCIITATGTATVYGIYANADVSNTQKRFVNLTSTANTVSATATNGNDAYALRLITAKSDYTGNALFYGQEYACASNATIHGGTYTAKATGATVRAVAADLRAITPTGADIAYPELIINGGTFSAEAGTSAAYALSAGGNTTIDGGTFTAKTGTTEARGFDVTAGKLTATNARLAVTAGTGAARGIHLGRGRNEYSANSYDTEVELNNLIVNATTITGNTACGLSTDASQNSTWTDATFQAYCIKTLKCLNADGSVIEGKEEWYEKYNRGYQRGEFVNLPKSVIINSGTYTAIANGTTSYGIYLPNTGVSATGKSSASTSLTMQNATISATTETGATARGVYTSGSTTIDHCNISATSATTTAQGIYIYDKKTILSNSTITATGASASNTNYSNGVAGVYVSAFVSNNAGNAGWKYYGELESENNVVTATATNGNHAYGLWLQSVVTSTTNLPATGDYYAPLGDYAAASSANLTEDVYTAKASGTNAYAIGFQKEAVKNEVAAAPTCVVNSGKYWGEAGDSFADVPQDALVGNLLIKDGYFRNKTNVWTYVPAGVSVFDLPTTTAEYQEGYRYFLDIAAVSGEYVCEVVGKQQFKTLEEALQYVNINTGTFTIRMLRNYTLSAGNYILPANTTLLIPYEESQRTIQGITPAWKNKYAYPNNTPVDPSPFRKLTFDAGVNFTVCGTIEASSTLHIGQNNWTGRVGGPYGWLYLSEGASVDLESGAKLIAWGYVTGKGEINAKAGSVVYEDFQMANWRGGTISSGMQKNGQGVNGKSVFLISDYYYQNVECPIVFRPGAKSIGYTGTFMEKGLQFDGKSDPITMVGETDAMFLMSPATVGNDTWVRKEYDAETDRLVWTLNSGAEIGSMTLKINAAIGSVNMKSTDYVLPLASNFKVVANEGEIRITNDILLQPGVELFVCKEATIVVPSGQNVFIYDQDDWSKWGSYYYKLSYSPTWGKNSPRTATQLPDAKVQIEGTFDIQGSLWTTAGGANICSTREKSGKVRFRANAPISMSAADGAATLNQIIGTDSDNKPIYDSKAITSAKLLNGDGTFTPTENSITGDVYTYMEDPADGVYRWISVRDNGCFTELKSSSTTQYIRPSDVVAVEENTNGDHAYHNAEQTRYFVNTMAKTSSSDCVWWEAEPKGTIDGVVYYMANNKEFDNYGTYFYWNDATSYWVAKKVTITFKNDDGTVLENGDFGNLYSYNVIPEYFGANPVKKNDATYKYPWTGWDTEQGHQGTAQIGRNEPLPVATADMTYYAHFDVSPYQYCVTFKNTDETIIDAGLWQVGEVPVCNNIPVVPAESWEIVGWEDADGNQYANDALPAVTKVVDYKLLDHYLIREFGDVLDVVDWSADGYAVLNMNGYSSPSAKADWTITAAGIDYTKTNRETDRTLRLNLTQNNYKADDEVLIVAKGKDGIVESYRKYKVPHIFDADATLGAVAADNSSVLFVRSGKLTVERDATVAAIYVAPDAELCIKAGVTLAAGKLVLRTEAFASAVLTNNGTLLSDKVYYSRIVANNKQAYPFALPFGVDLSEVRFSHDKSAQFGTHFGLLYYDAQQRADKGNLHGGNWVGLSTAETTRLNACQGYQLLSASAYYSEYCFPVTYPSASAPVPVRAYSGESSDKGDWGWNAVCSPSAGRCSVTFESPDEAVKISLPNADNATYRQVPAQDIAPASLFFYQAAADGELSFAAGTVSLMAAPRSVVARQMPATFSSLPVQWIRLFCGNNAGMMDETSIYLHPDKFSVDYQTGYDVVKLSKQGASPFVWSVLPYGDMAFAALPDSVAECGIALTVFAPQAEEMYFSLQDNDWLARLEHLWLLDAAEEVRTDLLREDYSWMAQAGTHQGRFFLNPVVRENMPDNNTGWTELRADDFLAYAVGKTIVVEHLAAGSALQCYDATGRLVARLTANAELLTIAVPASGMYFVQADNGVKKVMVNK